MNMNSYILHTPERSREDHATIRVGHVRDVPSIIAHAKAGLLSILTHPGVGSSRVLVVRDYERLVGVDGAPVKIGNYDLCIFEKNGAETACQLLHCSL